MPRRVQVYDGESSDENADKITEWKEEESQNNQSGEAADGEMMTTINERDFDEMNRNDDDAVKGADINDNIDFDVGQSENSKEREKEEEVAAAEGSTVDSNKGTDLSNKAEAADELINEDANSSSEQRDNDGGLLLKDVNDEGVAKKEKDHAEEGSTEVGDEKTATKDDDKDDSKLSDGKNNAGKDSLDQSTDAIAMEVGGDDEKTDKKDDDAGQQPSSNKRKEGEQNDASEEPESKKMKGDDAGESSSEIVDLTQQQQQQDVEKPANNTNIAVTSANAMAMMQQQQQQQFNQQQSMMNQMGNPQMMMNSQMMFPWNMQNMQNMQMVQAAQANMQVNMQANMAVAQQAQAAQQMMMILARQQANAKKPVPPGQCYQLNLTLPPPEQKLGLLLDDNVTYGLPELKNVASNSSIRRQIPAAYQKDCCIISLKSHAFGLVEPKTAQQCASLISRAQAVMPPRGAPKLELVLVQTRATRLPPSQKTFVTNKRFGRKSANEKYEYDMARRNALLDFFTEGRDVSTYIFVKERKLPDYLRNAIARLVKNDRRLSGLVSKRDDLKSRREAFDIIDEILPDNTETKEQMDWEVKAAMEEFYADNRFPTLAEFAQEMKLDKKIRLAMEKLLENDENLKAMMKERHKRSRRADIAMILQNMFPDRTAERASTNRRYKTLLREFFSDMSHDSVSKFCEGKDSIDASERSFMIRLVDRNKRLTQLVGMRNVVERREQAFIILDELLPDDPGASKGGRESDTAASEEMNPADSSSSNKPFDFFSPSNIKEVAGKLDFGARPRIARDGSKEIEIHDRKAPDELLTLLTFDLINRVTRGRALAKSDRDRIGVNCAKILFYDHGYKKVGGVSNLEKTWGTRLEKAYISGSNTDPLQRCYIGQVSYIDKIEREHPGLIAKLHAYAENLIGRDAPFTEKAMVMNEKSMEDAEDDPMKPVLELHPNYIRQWENQRKSSGGDGGGRGSSQNKPEGDLSLDQIQKRYPGMIDELYNFAIEAMGPEASYHILATCMSERAKEYAEENPTAPNVIVTKLTLPTWLRKHRKEGLR